jgi:hypothetical protein
MTDLQRAYNALSGKQSAYTTAWRYYDGDQPLKYSTERLRELFRSIDVNFKQNWCAVVIDAVTDRVVLTGFDVGDKTASDALQSAWNANRLNLDAADVHEAALVTGEAFIIGWKNDDGKTEIYYNDPRMVHVFYQEDNPKLKEFAAKWWVDASGFWKMNLYYADRVEHYTTRSKSQPQSANAFKPDEIPVEKHDFQIIPVFHFRRTRRGTRSELANVIPQNDAVNKLLSDMMVAAEFGAFKQRYIISAGDTSDLKNSPGLIWNIPGGDGQGQQTAVGEFTETSLDGYLNAIDKLVNAIAIISRTPKHYFMNAGAGVSGDALIAMEAPLVKKVEKLQEAFAPSWQEVAEFILRQSGINIVASDIVPTWKRAESVQPVAEAQARQANVNSGVPLVTALRWEGKSANEITQMEKDQKDEQARTKTLAQSVMDVVKTNDAQTNPVTNGNQNSNPANNGNGENKNVIS